MNNFIGTFNLKNQNDKQFVYSSQLYGTYFNVYAQVVLDNNQEEIKELRLYLLNYKGNLNLGLVKDEMENQKVEVTEGEVNFKLHVKALEATNGETSFCTLPFEGIKLSNVNFMVIERELHPLRSSGGKAIALSGEVFDSEFFERDGVFEKSRSNPEDSVEIAKSPGRRCRTSRLQLVKV